MVNIQTLRSIALSLPETTEEPHFEKTSFRVKKKIFATYDDIQKRVCIKLTEIEQDIYCNINPQIIYPVKNKWGKQGWTLIDLQHIERKLLIDAIKSAYCTIAPKKLATQISGLVD
jgi:predicted DNA-binding protein (MmcQ/YjbR family)